MTECGGRIPGPGYGLKSLTGYEGHDFSKNRAPAYSLGLRTNLGRTGGTPGPYNVSGVDRFGKYPNQGWTIESRGARKDYTVSPGPLAYAPEKCKPYTPAFSLGLKVHDKGPAFGPSPAEYFPQYGQGPGYTFGMAHKKIIKEISPGPKAAVPTDLYKNRAPAYSLGLKGQPLFASGQGPGPKYYPKLPHCPCFAYSFGMKHHKCAPPLITYDDN